MKLGRAPDPDAVASEWARLYSSGRREHRVASILFAFDRERDTYLEL